MTITNPKAHKGDQKGIKNFTYDATYADDAKQEDLYEENFRSLGSFFDWVKLSDI